MSGLVGTEEAELLQYLFTFNDTAPEAVSLKSARLRFLDGLPNVWLPYVPFIEATIALKEAAKTEYSLVDMVQDLSKYEDRIVSNRKALRVSNAYSITCWNCNEKGHGLKTCGKPRDQSQIDINKVAFNKEKLSAYFSTTIADSGADCSYFCDKNSFATVRTRY
jgi:hypothetical protein